MGKEKERGREGRDGWMQGREGRKWGERWGMVRVNLSTLFGLLDLAPDGGILCMLAVVPSCFCWS